ncbi:MAG: tetratricopeptide repeat protein, partial [Verrucomicrobia bacterium]
RYHERYHWPLGAAILLLFVEMLMPERKRAKTRTSNIQHPTSNVQATTAVALLICVMVPRVAAASPAKALKDFNRGNFTNALTEYERLLAEQTRQQKPEDPRLQFNAGDAAYRATNYDAAIQHFSAVLAAQDIRLQAKAYYNLGNVHFRLGEKADDLDKLQEAWEEAIKQYDHAVALDKTDEDAKFNLAFVKNAVEQIKQFKEAMRRAKSEADSAVRRRSYHRAVEIMDALMQNKIAAKQFQEFTKKLKDIDAIANPQPATK